MATFNKIGKLTKSYRAASKNLVKSVKSSSIGSNVDAAKDAVRSARSYKLFQNRADNLNRRVAMDNAKDISLNRSFGVRNAFDQVGKDFATAHFRPYNRVEPSLSNAFTGYEVKSGVDAALAGGAMAFAVGTAAVRGAHMDDNTPTRMPEQAGSMPGLSYDGVANTSNGRRDLGATGDLVFGLHNSRRR
jgi:hypothetical protein